MPRLGHALIADDSRVYCKVMGTVLAPYCDSVVEARTVRDAIESVDTRDLDLVILDVVFPDGSGFDVLEHISKLPEPRPRVVMVTSYPAERAPEKVFRLGAVDYLSKPTTLRQILRALDFAKPETSAKVQHERWRCLGQACLVDDDSASGYVKWDLYNISLDGAFLETKGPIEVGTELELLLELGSGKARVGARVVRIQNPSWIEVAGVGVVFTRLHGDAEEVIRRAIEGTRES